MEPKDLLKRSRIKVAAETFSLVSLNHLAWLELLKKPELSPRMTSSFMILMDSEEVTLMLDDTDFANLRSELANSRIEGGYRLLTFDIELDLGVVGFMAEVSSILAEAKVPIMALSAFSRDHLLIKQADLATALKALGG